MSPSPTGTVTFLFTDVEGSTRLWERDPDAASVAIERHERILRTAIEAHGGAVFKTVGDAVHAAFSDAGAAVRAALDAQRAIAAEDWQGVATGLEPLRVRIALHSGAARERAGDYFGPPLSAAARLIGAARGGQILLSETTARRVRRRLPRGATLRDWGVHRLKDLRHATRIYQLLAPDLADIPVRPDTVAEVHPRDRITIDESAPERTMEECDAALLAAVEERGEPVALSADQLRSIAARRPSTLRQYRLSRIAEWSQDRFRLHGRFVPLPIVLEEEATSAAGAVSRHYDLRDLMTESRVEALVLLGAPGSGKTTLLRRLELDIAHDELRREMRGEQPAESGRVTFLARLFHHRPASPNEPRPHPLAWLSQLWASRNPGLAPLAELLSAGRVDLLLDALNEMPAASLDEYREAILAWKELLQNLASDAPGNRLVFTCRTLDYAITLDSPQAPVPRAHIEPMSDAQVRRFLKVYSPVYWREAWSELQTDARIDLFRSPFYLKLLLEQLEDKTDLPTGRVGLLTGFLRHAIRREMQRDNPLFAPDDLVNARDYQRVSRWRWRSPHELPERGALVPLLSKLAHTMQCACPEGEASQVREGYDVAVARLDHARAEDALRAGMSLGVLVEDAEREEIRFAHQQVQQYFAARHLARHPDPRLVGVPWLAVDAAPPLDQLLHSLAPADSLPPLRPGSWDETTIQAAVMQDGPDEFVRAVRQHNLPLAGLCAAEPELRGRLAAETLDELRHELVARSRRPEADLRARIAAALALGLLGDPRFEQRSGAAGAFLVPPLVAVPEGSYTIGGPASVHEQPAHAVPLAPFSIGRFTVTNAEWARFIAAGGYEDERWWRSDAARAWRRGEGTAAAMRDGLRIQRDRFRAEPERLARYRASGRFSAELHELWLRRLRMPEDEFEAHLVSCYPGGRETAPWYWHDQAYNNPAQPVVGVSWFEARAYCDWLAATSGMPFRLPSEVEWEAAVRGAEARRYAYGDKFDPLRGNTLETHVRRPTPVGVFPEGDSPFGVADATGNVWEWTSSLFGRQHARPDYRYPYAPTDGREALDASETMVRVARGGSWGVFGTDARASRRGRSLPTVRSQLYGLRVAVTGTFGVAVTGAEGR